MPLFRKTTSPSHERTSDERERERFERARRRAERAGVPFDGNGHVGAVPQSPPDAYDEAVVEDGATDDGMAADPHADGAPSTPEHAPPPAGVPAPAGFEPPAPPAAAPPPAMAGPAEGSEIEHPDDEDFSFPVAPGPADPDAGERRLPPPPTRREVLLERRRRRVARDRTAARQRRGPISRGRAAALLALLAAAFAIWFLVSLFQPFHGSGSGQQIVTIPRGSSASRIGNILAGHGVVASGFFFNLRATLSGKRGDLHSGTFRLRRGMSYSAAIDALSKPPPAVITIKVLIPEGTARRQIAALAAADGLTGSYLAASQRSPLLDPARYGAPRGTSTLEGFLFPATYELRAGASASQLVAQQLTAFRKRYGTKLSSAARAHHLTPYQLVTVASMIEREAEVARDRTLIAAVIYNRHRDGIPLGIDATIRYALNDWSRPLTESDLRIASPYNSRTHKGLPPTPISNPGGASISAAEHPARVSYLYYVAGADGCGEHVFSSSYAQFQRDAAAYQEAVAHNGGRVPTCKHR